MTSHHNPALENLFGRPSQRENPAAVAQFANMLNAASAAQNSRSRFRMADSSEESDISSDGDDSEDDGSEYISDASEIESNEPDKIEIRKGKKLKIHRKFLESSPRRHSVFEDVKSEPEIGDVPSVLSLDDHCINLILSHVGILNLFKLSTLSKRFYNLCHKKLSSLEKLSTRNLYREVYPKEEILNQSNLVTVLSATEGNLKELTLYSGVGFESYDCGIYFTKEMSTTVSRNCRNLEVLVIEFNKLGGLVGLESFAKHLPAKNELKSLALKGFDRKRDAKVLSEGLLGDLLKKTKNLEKIHIESSDLIDGSSIIKYLKENKMTSFSFCNCKNLDDELLDFILKNHHKTLEHLRVYEYFPKNPWECDYDLITNLPTLDVNTKSPKLSNVKSFFAMRYDDCMPISFDGNVNLSLLQLMPNLKELDLSFNCDLDESPYLLRSVAAMCPLIEDLKLCGANIRDVRSLKPLENLFFLKELSLFNACCNYDTPNWSIFDHVTFGREVAPLLTALTYLNLENTDIKDAHIFSLVRNCPTLTFLETDLAKCDGSFIEKCRSISRSSPVTVATTESKGDINSKFRAALKRCPKFLTVKLDYMFQVELKAWYNDY